MEAGGGGLAEYQLAATLMGEFMERGCEGAAYPSIVASGPDGLVLHYSKNDRRIDSGQTLLIDAGAMCQGYTADVTRTIPVGGRFSRRQREIYDAVLGAQKAAIAAVKPGATIAELNRVAREYIEGRGLGQFWAHGVSHHVGLEVHDAADNSAVLAEGMVITVEPGLYVGGGKHCRAYRRHGGGDTGWRTGAERGAAEGTAGGRAGARQGERCGGYGSISPISRCWRGHS